MRSTLPVIATVFASFIAGVSFTLGVFGYGDPVQVVAAVEPENAPRPVAATAPAPAVVLPAKLVDIHDGDTLTVEVRYAMRIRMLDCWAPEIRGRQKVEGQKSAANLRALAAGKTDVVVSVPWHQNIGDMTTLGRVLGHVYLDGRDLSEAQVSAGVAAKTREAFVAKWGEP